MQRRNRHYSPCPYPPRWSAQKRRHHRQSSRWESRGNRRAQRRRPWWSIKNSQEDVRDVELADDWAANSSWGTTSTRRRFIYHLQVPTKSFTWTVIYYRYCPHKLARVIARHCDCRFLIDANIETDVKPVLKRHRPLVKTISLGDDDVGCSIKWEGESLMAGLFQISTYILAHCPWDEIYDCVVSCKVALVTLGS